MGNTAQNQGDYEYLTDQGPTNSYPLSNFISYAYNYGLSLVSQYGWYILLGIVLLAVVYQWLKRQQNLGHEQRVDPAIAERYQDGMCRSREKMQRELNEKAAQAQANKDLKRDSEARDERIKQWEEKRLKSKSKSPGFMPPHRREYFPLDSAGGFRGYRPPRRTGRGG